MVQCLLLPSHATQCFPTVQLPSPLPMVQCLLSPSLAAQCLPTFQLPSPSLASDFSICFRHFTSSPINLSTETVTLLCGLSFFCPSLSLHCVFANFLFCCIISNYLPNVYLHFQNLLFSLLSLLSCGLEVPCPAGY